MTICRKFEYILIITIFNIKGVNIEVLYSK
jgi:hypothetical protein